MSLKVLRSSHNLPYLTGSGTLAVLEEEEESKSSHESNKKLEPQLEENKVQSEKLEQSDAIASSEDITLDKSTDEESNSNNSNSRAGGSSDGAEGMKEDRKDIDCNKNEVFILIKNNFKKVLEILKVQHIAQPKRGE
ncbi:hypothetical protein BDZ91DRAFT_802884 [Kalaharituber pfeilii]|nr:hypothetical protein BDZ91DRAFT_802884 [Kalaharituber pfeilii]